MNSAVDKLFVNPLGAQWDAYVGDLRSILTERKFEVWMGTMRLGSYSEGHLELKFECNFSLGWVQKHYRDVLLQLAKKHFSDFKELSFTLDKETKQEFESFVPTTTNVPKQEQVEEVSSPKLNPEYRFENFVAKGNFQMAHAISMEIARNPGQVDLNPFIIHGATGLGKTHLAMAIGHYCFENKTAPKVVFRTSDEFLSEFVSGVKNASARNSKTGFKPIDGQIMGMSKEFLEADLLVIDDIQFLKGKVKTQDHFCKILNSLMALNKQVVVTCDQDPQSFQASSTRDSKRSLNDQILHKFRSGTCIEIERLEPVSREAIFRDKLKRIREVGYVSEDVIQFLAECPLENVREVEGTINKLLAYKEIMKKEITVDFLRVVLGDVARNAVRKVTIDGIIEAVSEEMSIPVEMIVSHSRIHKAALPRKIAMYLSRELTDNSLHTIGLSFGRDYSTVIFNLKALVKLMERDPNISAVVKQIKEKITNP